MSYHFSTVYNHRIIIGLRVSLLEMPYMLQKIALWPCEAFELRHKHVEFCTKYRVFTNQVWEPEDYPLEISCLQAFYMGFTASPQVTLNEYFELYQKQNNRDHVFHTGHPQVRYEIHSSSLVPAWETWGQLWQLSPHPSILKLSMFFFLNKTKRRLGYRFLGGRVRCVSLSDVSNSIVFYHKPFANYQTFRKSFAK